MKKRSERRKHCALAVVRRSQKFSPRHRPPSPGARDGQNLSVLRCSLYLYLQSQFGEDRCTQFRVIVVTHKHTHTHTHTNKQTNPQTGPITIHCAADSAQYRGLITISRAHHALHADVSKSVNKSWLCRKNVLVILVHRAEDDDWEKMKI